MASKDTTKIVLAGTAICSILLLFYIYKKRSKSQGTGTTTVAASVTCSNTQESKDAKEKPSDKQQELGKQVTHPLKPTESKIPQKIQSKPDVKPPSATPTKTAPAQNDPKAGGESVQKDATSTQPTQIVQPKLEQAISSAPVQTSPALSNEHPVTQIQQAPSQTEPKKPTEQKTKVPTEEPTTQKQEQPTPADGQSNQTAVQESVQPTPPVNEDSKSSKDDTVRSEASIVLSPKPTEELPSPSVQNGVKPSIEGSADSQATEVSAVQNKTEQTKAVSKSGLDVEAITKAIQMAKSSPANIDKETIDILVQLLRQKDVPLLQTSLDCIVRCGAFSQNQSLLRESGCIQELTLLLQVHAVAARTGVPASQSLLGSINNAIINLCMDIQNQARLEVCIPVLIDLITYEKSPDDVQLMSLKSLTNLSTTPSYHEQYIPAILRLFTMMDAVNGSIRLQSVKVLVNLSCNPEIIPDILTSKAPKCLLKCLEPQTDSILLLRIITLLVNLVSCVREGKIPEDDLPSELKPAIPNSMYNVLFGEDNSEQLKVKVKGLTRHSTENVSKQAIRLFEHLK